MVKLKRIKGKIKTSLKAYKFGLFNAKKLIKFIKVAPDEKDLIFTPQLTVFEAKEHLDKGELVIVDVRSIKDFENAHIDGAIHMDLFNVLDNISKLPKDKIIGILCYGGGASLTVTQMLLDREVTNARNIKGGIIRYALDLDDSLLGDL